MVPLPVQGASIKIASKASLNGSGLWPASAQLKVIESLGPTSW
jgi:hypothetical protein